VNQRDAGDAVVSESVGRRPTRVSRRLSPVPVLRSRPGTASSCCLMLKTILHEVGSNVRPIFVKYWPARECAAPAAPQPIRRTAKAYERRACVIHPAGQPNDADMRMSSVEISTVPNRHAGLDRNP